MAKFSIGSKVIVTEDSPLNWRTGTITGVSEMSEHILYVRFRDGGAHVPVGDQEMRAATQQCKDCNGTGETEKLINGIMTWLACCTCDGNGRINRTSPYRLRYGTWSDGVDRRLPLSERAMNLGRWEVTRSDWEDAGWLAQFKEHSEMIGCHEREFPTHAEAIAYADRMARTTKNGENK